MSFDPVKQCAFTTFSGQACRRKVMAETPYGRAFCAVTHERGTKKASGGQNGLCSCGSWRKYKKCCGLLPADAEHQIRLLDEEDDTPMKAAGGLAKATAKTVYSVGFNLRRWVFGYERDSRWRANILYFGPLYFSRRSRTPRALAPSLGKSR